MTKEPIMESAEEVATKIVDRMDRDVELYHHGSETTAARKICIDRITDLLTSYANARVLESREADNRLILSCRVLVEKARNAALDEAAMVVFKHSEGKWGASQIIDEIKSLKSKEPS